MLRFASAALATVAALACALPTAAQLHGRITDAASGAPVAGAVVQLTVSATRIQSTTHDGRYHFGVLRAGRYCVHVQHAGYRAADVCVDVGSSSLALDLPLVLEPFAVAAIYVNSERGATNGHDHASAAEERTAHVNLQQLRGLHPQSSNALAELLLVDRMREPPSDPAGGRHPHALLVWGSSATRGRVLFDGATVNAPLHMGALLPPLEPELLDAADLHSGGASPRYDGGTSHIMEFRTRPARTTRVFGEADLLTARLGGETMIGERAGFAAAARRVNHEVIDRMLARGFGYGYADAMLRGDWNASAHSRFHIAALHTNEIVRMPRDFTDDEASWQNRAAVLNWRRDRGADRSIVSAALSEGVADLPLLSAPGAHLEAVTRRASVSAEQHWRAGPASLTLGTEIERVRFARRSYGEQDQCTASLPCVSAASTFAAAFGEASLQLANGVATSLGTRIVYDVSGSRLELAPRASITAIVEHDLAVTLAAGVFTQPVAAMPPQNAEARAFDVGLTRASHVELHVRRYWTTSFVNAAAYLRHHAAGERTEIGGIDVAYGRQTTFGILTLGYAASTPAAPDASGMQHLGSAGFAGEHGPWRVALAAAFGAGLPYTTLVLEQPPVPVIGPTLTGGPEGTASASRDYARIDASLGWNRQWRRRARTVSLMPYARVINALSQRDALFYFRRAGTGEQAEPLARLPAVPVIGVRWEF